MLGQSELDELLALRQDQSEKYAYFGERTLALRLRLETVACGFRLQAGFSRSIWHFFSFRPNYSDGRMASF
jgi:hypothetical protein